MRGYSNRFLSAEKNRLDVLCGSFSKLPLLYHMDGFNFISSSQIFVHQSEGFPNYTGPKI